MKILNLYSGIGGNRKLWGDTHEITAVEFDPKIAAIYQSFFPNDTVVVGDAHQYLLDHYSEFDFIWASPPCPTHSITNYFLNAKGHIRYPDMSLYQEVIFLQAFYTGKYVIENVIPYYEPLIKPQYSGRHVFWANFPIPKVKAESTIGRMCGKKEDLGGLNQSALRDIKHKELGFDLTDKKHPNKTKLLNNCVVPEIGLAILESVLGIYNQNNVEQVGLFAL
tara:strand:+ start:81 stop:746 length:666 start_codon:yes stop_codon:yes gene_type:complete